MNDNTTLEVVAPGIRRLALRTPTLPPATHTNAYFVGERDLILIEPASAYPEEIDLVMRHVDALAAAGATFRAIFVTHHHADHVGGAALLRDRLSLPLFAHEKTAARLEGRMTFDALLSDQETWKLKGTSQQSFELRAIHTPGHAPGHLCFHEVTSGALIAGDMVAGVGTILVEPQDGDMALYLKSLSVMKQLRPKVLLPAHGDPITRPDERLDLYIRHRAMRETKILESMSAAIGVHSMDSILERAYDDVPKHVFPLARLSLEAHLIKLERDGKVERRDLDAWVRL